MSFQPFGYRFDIASPLSPAEVKAAIRERRTGVFDRNNGARGWVAGRFFCLWFSALRDRGPMLFGWITRAESGSHIRGRAGSDLNGMLWSTLLMPIAAGTIFDILSQERLWTVRFLLLVALLLIGIPLIYWMAHKDRKEAEPLLRFLHRAAVAPRTGAEPPDATPVRRELQLNLNGVHLERPFTREALQDALLRLGKGDFLILDGGPEIFLQTASLEDGYILELRERSAEHHRGAVRTKAALPQLGRDRFSHDEVTAAMNAYAGGAPIPDFLRWAPIDAER